MRGMRGIGGTGSAKGASVGLALLGVFVGLLVALPAAAASIRITYQIDSGTTGPFPSAPKEPVLGGTVVVDLGLGGPTNAYGYPYATIRTLSFYGQNNGIRFTSPVYNSVRTATFTPGVYQMSGAFNIPVQSGAAFSQTGYVHLGYFPRGATFNLNTGGLRVYLYRLGVTSYYGSLITEFASVSGHEIARTTLAEPPVGALTAGAAFALGLLLLAGRRPRRAA